MVDPFAGAATQNSFSTWEYSNDINPTSSAKFHMKALVFLKHLVDLGVRVCTTCTVVRVTVYIVHV